MNATRNWKEETVAGACESRSPVRNGAALRIQIQLLLIAASLGGGSVITLRVQLVADGGTNTLANVTNSITGTVTVGTNGSFRLLVLSDNALLTSPASRWLMGTDLGVGQGGASKPIPVS